LLRVHAGIGHGERPPGDLPPAWGGLAGGLRHLQSRPLSNPPSSPCPSHEYCR
jgi:hypothetical protein